MAASPPTTLKARSLSWIFTRPGAALAWRAIPHNNELLKKYKDQGLVIIGVCTNKRGQESFATNAREHDIQYPAARDPELKSQEAWAVHYYPTYAIIDRKGIVRVIGLQPPYVETVVKKLLAEPAP